MGYDAIGGIGDGHLKIPATRFESPSGVGNRPAEVQMVAFKFMIRSWELSQKDCQRRTPPQFVRCGLPQLDPGYDLDCLITGRSTKRAIAPAEGVLALFYDFCSLSKRVWSDEVSINGEGVSRHPLIWLRLNHGRGIRVEGLLASQPA